MILKKHIDGTWYTSEYLYNDYSIVIKSFPNKGIKSHIIKDDKVIKTFRYNFITPEKLLEKSKNYINDQKRN